MVDKKFNQMSRCLSRKSKKTGKEKVKCLKKVLETRMFFVLVFKVEISFGELKNRYIFASHLKKCSR